MIVIDASALAAYILREEGYPEIKEHLRFKTASLELAAKETVNAIYLAYRRGRINEEQACRALEALTHILDKAIQLFDQKHLLSNAFKVSIKHAITIYDALYIALAKELQARLLTRDYKQAKAAKEEGIEVILI